MIHETISRNSGVIFSINDTERVGEQNGNSKRRVYSVTNNPVEIKQHSNSEDSKYRFWITKLSILGLKKKIYDKISKVLGFVQIMDVLLTNSNLYS